MRSLVFRLLCIGLFVPMCGLAQAPITPPVPTTKVLAIANVVANGSNPEAMRSTMPSEVKATLELYLNGKIDQWFVRQDGKGVVFLLNASSVEEAAEMLSKLPLVQAKRLEFTFMALGPLSPLRYLTGEAGDGAKH